MRPGKKEFPSDRIDLKKLWSLLHEKPPGRVVSVEQARESQPKRLAS